MASRRWTAALGYVLLAALAYVPVLRTARGRVAADTKQYLYLDPGKLLERAPSLWDPNVHFGTVTHQNIGYLFPAGPFYWTFDRLGVPDWVAQRLWLGTILFGAACGVLFLLRTLGVAGPGVVVAALVYMLSPYTLDYSARISILLIAWAALPWMIALVDRALRDGGWRAPAAFALLVQLAGSVNATALLLVGLGPVLWLLFVVVVTREATWRRAGTTALKIGLLSLLASAWWIAGLSIQAGYGLNVLEYTETIPVVSITGHSGEVLRGLGYWFFYGGDRLGPWTEASVAYMARPRLILFGYALPILGFLAASVTRWKYRAYFVGLVVVGVVIAVGVHPYQDPSWFGEAMKAFSQQSTAGLALRSVGRAVPLIALGSAVLIGVGVNLVVAWMRPFVRWRPLAMVPAVVVVGIAVLNLPALWNGTFYGKNLQRNEALPAYWIDAIASLDARGVDTRILEVPGSDFTSYRWGNTVEPITPGLTDRPYVARELIPYGSPASAQLLEAFDRRLQLGTLEPTMVVPTARLFSVGDVVSRSDLAVDRFDLARPREVAQLLGQVTGGISGVRTFGDDLGPSLVLPLLDERALAIPPGTADPAPVTVYRISDPRPLLRAETGAGLVVAGDGEGILDLGAIGLLAHDVPVRYSASVANDPAARRRLLADRPVIVVTDSNRRRAQRWENVRDSIGYTERAGETALARDPSDHRLDVFPGATDAARTVMNQQGGRVSASGYGARNVYLPADRPARAFDGDLMTAWRVGAYGPVQGERIRLDLDTAIESGTVNLVQPLTGPTDRFITAVTLRFTDREGHPVGDSVRVELGPASRTAEGQTVNFPRRRFSRMEVVIDADNVGKKAWYPQESAVGFAEIRLRDESAGTDIAVSEVVRMPRDLVDTPGAASTEMPLVYVMTRLRNRVAPPNISEEETTIVRSVRVPAAREFGLIGQARLAPTAPGEVVDRALGLADASAGGVTVRASDHLATSLAARASSAVDGDASTAWTTGFGSQSGRWIEVETSQPLTFDHLDLAVVADGTRSVPTRVRVSADGDERVVDVPAVTDGAIDGAVVPAPVAFAPLTGSRIRVTVEGVRERITREYYSGRDEVAPIGVAELGIPGLAAIGSPSLTEACRDDLVSIDDQPVPVRISGDPEAAGAGEPLAVTACENRTSVALAKGDHVIRTAPGARTGLDLDRIVLASDRGGAGLVLDRAAAGRVAAAASEGGRPTVRVWKQGRTSWSATVRGIRGPFQLVLGQSYNQGWRAEVDGKDLGAPQLIDGLANGWRVDPGTADQVDVRIVFEPQRRVRIAMAVSAITVIACVLLMFLGRRRASGPRAAPELESPLVARGTAPSTRTVFVTSVGLGFVGAVVAAPWVGVVTALLTALSLRRPRWRVTLALGAPLALSVVALYIVVQQVRYDYPSVLEWPTYFDRVHVLGLFAVMLLLADTVVRVVRDRAEPR